MWTLIGHLVYFPECLPKLYKINSVVEVLGIFPWYILSIFQDGCLPYVECCINGPC